MLEGWEANIIRLPFDVVEMGLGLGLGLGGKHKICFFFRGAFEG